MKALFTIIYFKVIVLFMDNLWKRCAVCKKGILPKSLYQKCSISSCRKHAFCSVNCWNVHSSTMGHKSAWAEESKAPTLVRDSQGAVLREVRTTPSQEREVLIIASKLKNYIRTKHGLNTSANVLGPLSDLVRTRVDEAVANARAEGRKTLLDRDLK